MGLPEQLTCLLSNLYASQEAIFRTRHGTTNWLKIGKGVRQSYFCHSAYLTFMQNTSCKSPGWMKIKLELRLPGEMSITTDMRMIPPKAESEEELKSLLMRVKDENEKADLKLNMQKTRIMASGPITSWQMLFSPAGMSNSLWPHGLQHTRLPWPSPSPKAYSNSCPLSQWCYPTIPSFVIPFHSCLQSFPASGSFLMSHLFASGSQNIGVSTSVLPMNI